MDPSDGLKIELAKEEKLRKKGYLVKIRAVQKEEILHLKTIEFRSHILKHELEKQLIPYLQRNSGEARFVLDSIEENDVIKGKLANMDSRVRLSFIPGYDGHGRAVYSAIDFYPDKNIELSDPIMKSMRDARDNITKYFKKAEVVGRDLQKPKFPPS